MAKKNNNNPQQKQEKREGILGFFDSIKEFFQNLIEKIKIALEFNKRVEDGRFHWEGSQEQHDQRVAQEKDREFGFRTMEEHQQDQIHFPGYYEMQMQDSGLLRIPPKVDLLWQEKTPEALAQRYLTAMEDRFAGRPEPITSHDGQAFAEVAKDMRVAAQRGDSGLHQFIVGNTHIVSQVENGKINLSISDGLSTRQFTGLDAGAVSDTLMSAYTELVGKGEPVYYIDTRNNTKSVSIMGENGYETFTAHTVTGYTGEGDNKTRYDMPNVLEVSGPNRNNPQVVEAMIGKQEGVAVEDNDLRAVVTRAYKQAERNGGDSSIYLLGDKMMWASQHDGNISFNIVPHQCTYAIAPVTIPVTEKMFTDEGKPKFFPMFDKVKKGLGTIDQRIETAKTLEEQAQQAEAAAKAAAEAAKKNGGQETRDPWTARAEFTINAGTLEGSLENLAAQAKSQCTYTDGIAVQMIAGDHKITITGHEFERYEDYPDVTASVALDGKVLYNVGYDGKQTGSCTSLEEALKVVHDTIGDSEVSVTDYGYFDAHSGGDSHIAGTAEYDAFEADINI